MTYEKMLNTIMGFAKSQGFYGALYQQIIRLVSADATYRTMFEDLARQFHDEVDLVLYFEQ